MLLCHIFVLLISALALTLNGLLLYASIKNRSKSMGSYSFYMQACILLNLAYSSAYIVGLPILSQNKHSFAVAAAGPLRNQHFINQIMQIDCPTALILCSCFIYRYKILCRNDGRLVKRLLLLAETGMYFVAVGIFQSAIYVCLQPTIEITQSLGSVTVDVWELKLNETGYVGGILETGEKMSPTTLIFLVPVMLVFSVVISICFFCSVKIMGRLKSETMSLGTKRLNRKMFKLLLYQSLIPSCTSFSPCSFPIICFIMSWEPPSLLLYFIITFNSLFPLLNGMIIFKFVSSYRNCILSLLKDDPLPIVSSMASRTSRNSDARS